MTGFAGTGQLSKLAFRRDGVVLPACVFGIAALLAITAAISRCCTRPPPAGLR
jgi:putative exporter of polyketide antibiotics